MTGHRGEAARLGQRLAASTLQVVDIASVSRDEALALAWFRECLPPGIEVVDDTDAVVFAVPRVRRADAPFVVLVGHADTVPVAGNVPGHLETVAVVGRGACDMKGALAVMLELAAGIGSGAIITDLDVGFLCVGREELPITESALLPLLGRCPSARAADLAIVMEPTDNAVEVGCLGNLNARVVARGVAAHTARPWLGRNAIHTLIGALAPLADLPVREVVVDELVYREVIVVTTIAGGVAGNVVPDHAEAQVNYRYAPTTTPAEAEARLNELLACHDVELEIVGNAPAGVVSVRNPLVSRLRAAGDLPLRPKQAWTPVAEFATVGVDAVNFGPGDPQYAHRDDERVEVAALVRSYRVLRAFLGGGAAVVEGRA